jgi:hypothetical protein
MKRLRERLAVLEATTGQPMEHWIRCYSGPGDDGWECLPGNGLSANVLRRPGEDDASLKDRARQAMAGLRREGGPAGPVVYFFGIDRAHLPPS